MMHSCRCCLRRPPDKDLTTPYTHLGVTEIYADMLQQCFHIELVLGDDGSRGICSACVGRLRDASDFKLQVQRSQAEMQERLQGSSCIKGAAAEAAAKLKHSKYANLGPVYDFVPIAVETAGPWCAEAKRLVKDIEHRLRERGCDPRAGYYLVQQMSLAIQRGNAAGVFGTFGPEEEWTVEQGADGTNTELEFNEEPLVKSEIMYADGTPDEMLQEMPGAGIEDGDRTSEDIELMSYGELLIKPEMNDADEDETSDDMLHGELLIKPDMNDADEDETSDEMLLNSGGSATSAREQLAMACSVVLERLRGDATVHRRNKPYTCEHCGKCFRNKSTLRKHIRHTHLSNGPKQFSCDFCMSLFQTKLLVVEHEKTEHGVTNFICAECEYTTVYKKSLVTHLKSHTINNIFSYTSPDKTHLHTHQNIHTREQPFKCSNYDFNCRQKGDLQRHQRIHTAKKPYKCSLCNYKCSDRSNLKRHEMTHTGAKPFKCCNCDYKCSRKESLLLHQRIHTGEKPFTCSHCDYKCSRKPSLRIHERTHTGEKPYKCRHCDYRCSQKSHLRGHKRTHTGKKAS